MRIYPKIPVILSIESHSYCFVASGKEDASFSVSVLGMRVYLARLARLTTKRAGFSLVFLS